MRQKLVSVLMATTVLFGGSVVAGQASAATAPCRQNVYGPGGTGTCVKAIQSIANVLSISNAARREAGPIAIDSVYGDQTKNAIIKIQRAARAADHPNTKVDGWVGPQTWTVLCHYGAFWGSDTRARDAYHWAKSYAC
ncbi:peptidoglycan-binding protein [Kribbella turkmenica]|uniref:Peptidoglycan-binding protein n=1 Tax=Kribbella turkmenica TaxID=2530375 RepID=A0A4V2YEN1_9ACTN|nr:peptidoglycan-binding protein [Kribbella turkmenica]TDD19976.1 peptidoglycan-binding protein [Kribbella turkmenica]